MNIVTIKHTVTDYDKWKIGYDADEPNRRAAGATSEGSSDDDAEDTWLPVLAALLALLDPAPSRTKPATGEQAGPGAGFPGRRSP